MQTCIRGSTELGKHNAMFRAVDVSTRVRPGQLCYRPT